MPKSKHVLLASLFLFIFMLSQGSLSPQTTWKWERIYPTVSPSPGRLMFSIAYDSHRLRTVLFGGSHDNDRGLNDTWEYDGTTWVLRNPPEKPSKRWAYGLAYDSNNKVTVLFGGEYWPSTMNDTWIYNGTTWTEVKTPTRPKDRAHFPMAFDSKNKVTVMYGGWKWYSELGDTCLFDGKDWQILYPSPSPGKRQHAAMAYDEDRQVIVLFGGRRQYTSPGRDLNDTWEWDGSAWENTIVDDPSKDPSPRSAAHMVYDTHRKKIIMYGGNSNLQDTWEYEGTKWSLVETSVTPGINRQEGMAYDRNRQVVVLSRGTYRTPENDTWELFPGNKKPVAQCKDIEISVDLNCETAITADDVDNGSYDPDGDKITLSIDNAGPFSPGVYPVSLTVTDPYDEVDSCQALVTVLDSTPPVPNIAQLPDIVAQCSVTITNFPIASDNCVGLIQGTTTDPLEYNIQGEYIITWTYDDGAGNITPQEQKVIIDDISPPTVDEITVTPANLWPPNHEMILVSVTASGSDNCGDLLTTKIISIASNEPENGLGDGDTSPDWEITGDLTANLRAERSGTGSGRVYTITVECSDENGNKTTVETFVPVKHDKKKK